MCDANANVYAPSIHCVCVCVVGPAAPHTGVGGQTSASAGSRTGGVTLAYMACCPHACHQAARTPC